MTINGTNIYTTTEKGFLNLYDTRASKPLVTKYELSQNKIACVDVNPVDSSKILTCGNDRSFRVHDKRNMKKALIEYTHRLSCSSAYWNSTGSSIVSTSFDDTVNTIF
jgi:WD40 repeat protein